MEERPFTDKQQMPLETSLQAVLGSRFEDYQQLTVLVSSFSQAWNFSGSSGWMLKVFDRKKALFYLIPLNNAFKISLTIRENERERLRKDADLSGLWEKISAAKKYPEGYALQFLVAEQVDMPILIKFLTKLMALREN